MSVDVVTFGCRLNSCESDIIHDHASSAGMERTIVFNTCAVTTEAVRQAKQSIRRARRENPRARIIVTGCAAQINPHGFLTMPEVDHVIGNREKLEKKSYTSLLETHTFQDQDVSLVSDIMAVTETVPHMALPRNSRSRAFLQVQNGCDHRCTFCVIPFGRGPSRSVPVATAIQNARKLSEMGWNELVITGVDLTSYGHDLPERPTLGELVQAILHQVPSLKRLRLSSIDSIEVDPHLIRAIAEEERFMPHLHLSLQSGDDMILKRMKRRHNRSDAIRFCERLRSLRPDILFGADIIAGFPTETEDMFSGSLSIVDACDLTFLHVFPFSPHDGTPASRMPQLHRSIIKERAARLRTKGHEALQRYLSSQAGTVTKVLLEERHAGRTPHYCPVNLTSQPSHLPTPHCPPLGSLIDVRITGHTTTALSATLLEQTENAL